MERVNSNPNQLWQLGSFQFDLCWSDLFILLTSIAASAMFFAFLLWVNLAWAADIVPAKVIQLANDDRRAAGLTDLQENEKLSRAADQKALDMLTNDYFAHTSPKGITPWKWIEKEGYDYNFAGENLAMDFTAAEKMNQAWLASPTHRANILSDRYTDIGVAAENGLINGHETTVVVQMFGSGDKNAPVGVTPKVEAPEQSQKIENKYGAFPPNEENILKTSQKSLSLIPQITSPASGQTLAQGKVDILGRANPGAVLNIFDENFSLGKTVADENGWFKLRAENLASGEHKLLAQADSFTVQAKKISYISDAVSFAIDLKKPEVDYQISRGSYNRSGDDLLMLSTSKPNCWLKVGQQSIFLGSAQKIAVPMPEKWLSEMVKIEDLAGNKSFKEIDLAGLKREPRPNTLVNHLADVFSGGRILRTESAEAAFENNLGLAMAHQYR